MAGSRKKNRKNKSVKYLMGKGVTPIEDADILSYGLEEASDKPQPPKTWCRKVIAYFKERQIFSKIFIICFALTAFSFAYFNVNEKYQSMLTYIGLILTMLSAYIEILIIRDHLWIIEGSMPESRKWRQIFFNPSALRKQKFKKLVVLFFGLVVFAYIYRKRLHTGLNQGISFIGIILMITAVYYEILTIRDEITNIGRAVEQLVIQKKFKSDD